MQLQKASRKKATIKMSLKAPSECFLHGDQCESSSSFFNSLCNDMKLHL